MSTKKLFNLEEKMSQLQEIVQWFESGDDLNLDECMKKYQASQKLAAEIKQYLEVTKGQITNLN